MKAKYFLIISLFIISFLKTDFVQATAIKVSPPEIKIETYLRDTVQEEIIVENPSSQVALYEIYPDEFSDWIKFKPESFILESGDSKKVILEIENREAGTFATLISVVAKPISQKGFKANSGVKIPLEIRIIEGKEGFFSAAISQIARSLFHDSKNLIYVFGIILIMALGGIWIKKQKKRLKSKDQDGYPLD